MEPVSHRLPDCSTIVTQLDTVQRPLGPRKKGFTVRVCSGRARLLSFSDVCWRLVFSLCAVLCLLIWQTESHVFFGDVFLGSWQGTHIIERRECFVSLSEQVPNPGVWWQLETFVRGAICISEVRVLSILYYNARLWLFFVTQKYTRHKSQCHFIILVRFFAVGVDCFIIV